MDRKISVTVSVTIEPTGDRYTKRIEIPVFGTEDDVRNTDDYKEMSPAVSLFLSKMSHEISELERNCYGS